MAFGAQSPEAFIRDPEYARFICEALADCAAVSPAYSHRKAYQTLRSLAPQDLFELYKTQRYDTNDAFREAFGPVYNRATGEDVNGPLFDKVSS